MEVIPYKLPQLINPDLPIESRAVAKPTNPITSNPAYAPINAVVSNLGKTASPEAQRNLISSPAYTVMGRSTEEVIKRDSVQLPQ